MQICIYIIEGNKEGSVSEVYDFIGTLRKIVLRKPHFDSTHHFLIVYLLFAQK